MSRLSCQKFTNEIAHDVIERPRARDAGALIKFADCSTQSVSDVMAMISGALVALEGLDYVHDQ